MTGTARSMPAFRFDKAYYDKFYRDPRTRVATPAGIRRLGRFVCNYLKYVGQPVDRVLDAGCGLGYWKPVIESQFPKAQYVGIEISQYLCDAHGWTRASIVDYRSAVPFDLVICQGVLQYLNTREARLAIRNLRRLCRGALYLEALTVDDWERTCDRQVTDGDTYLRTGSWYRRALRSHFRSIGGGLFLSPQSRAVLFELEWPE